MVSSKDSHSVFESNFENNQESHSFHRVVPPVHIVSHEEVVGVWTFTTYTTNKSKFTNSEEFHKIVELSMYVSADSDWAPDSLDIAFFWENFLGLRENMREIAFDIIVKKDKKGNLPYRIKLWLHAQEWVCTPSRHLFVGPNKKYLLSLLKLTYYSDFLLNYKLLLNF